MNAVDLEMVGALRRAAADLAERTDLRVLVITAEGRYFTAGVDAALMERDLGVGADGIYRGSVMRRQYRVYHDFYDELEQIEKPVVLAAQGPCLGLGVELGSSCDFRLASDRATFGLPEIADLALIPGSGGISRLTRIVGPHWAKWLALAGQTVDAEQALAMGWLHAIYPSAEFSTRVDAFAHHLACLPGEAVGVAKMAIDTSASVDRRTARDFDRFAQATLIRSAEFQERLDRYARRGMKDNPDGRT
jgi:enoyl-CoA hydratase